MPDPFFSVLFDLDDTLHDDGVAVPLLVAAAAEHGHVLDPASVVKGERFIPRLQAEFGLSLAEAEFVYAGYVRMYHERAASSVRALHYAPELVAGLARAGARLGLITMKAEALAAAVLSALGLGAHFPVVIGGDSLPHRKPDPRVALAALERLGGHPGAAAIVGDTPADMACGRDAGLPLVIGVLGSVPGQALLAAGATHVVPGLQEAEHLLLRALTDASTFANRQSTIPK